MAFQRYAFGFAILHPVKLTYMCPETGICNTFDLEISRLGFSRLSQPTNSLFGVAIAGDRAQLDDTFLLVDRPLFPVGLNHSRLAFGSSNDIPLRLITCSLVFALAKRTHYMLCDVRFGKY